MPDFSRGNTKALKVRQDRDIAADLLDDETKKQLCLDVLDEIGARNIQRPNHKGEIIHSCPLPLGSHPNGDRRPSASLNYRKLKFNCLGCGASGGLVWFLATCRNQDSAEVEEWLNGQTGLGGADLAPGRLVEIVKAIIHPPQEAPRIIPVWPESALEPWDMPEPHPYLTDSGYVGRIKCRGIPAENCRRFRIGFAEHYPMGSFKDGFGHWVERRSQERITIPLFWEGQLLGWQARAIYPHDEPKYKNSMDLPRDRVLYGWPGPRQDIVLVESPMSVLRHCHHQPMVATFGGKVTETQMLILHRARSVTVWFDPDPGGWAGTELLVKELSPYVPLKVVDWPYRGVDPADLPDQEVTARITGALPWVLWKRPSSLAEWTE